MAGKPLPSSTAAGPTHPNKRVLVIDDDPDIRQMLEAVLRRACQVETAQNGSEGLARMSRAPAVDLVLCDISMPQLNGLDFIHRLRMLPMAKQVPVVIISANASSNTVILGIQLGAKHFITKPFVIDDLLKKVQKLLAG